MKWSLLVPGSLPPARIAAELLGAANVPQFAQRIASSSRAEQAIVDSEAPHWVWLVRAFGVAGTHPVTAPYAWAAREESGPARPDAWIAHCEVVHMALARDHLVPAGLGDAPLQPDESRELLASAREALQDSPFHLDVAADHWFLFAAEGTRPDLQCLPLDAVLGRSLQDRTPSGSEARAWRRLDNEIQMQWHRSATNSSREDRGARTANAVWIHGGGTWQRLARAPYTIGNVDAGGLEEVVLRGWVRAADEGHRSAEDVLSVCRALLPAYQHQAWESWVNSLPAVETRLEREFEEAVRRGADRIELILSGIHSARTFSIPLRKRRWPWQGKRDARGALRENLAETEIPGAAPQRHA